MTYANQILFDINQPITHLVIEELADASAAEVHGGPEEKEEAAHEHGLLRDHVPLAAQGRHREEQGERKQPLRAVQLALATL